MNSKDKADKVAKPWNDGRVNISPEILFVIQELKEDDFMVNLRRDPYKILDSLEMCVRKLAMARVKLLEGLGHISDVKQEIIEMDWKDEQTLNKYPGFVNGLFKEFPEESATYMHAAAGIAGEAGEVIDAVKKTWVYNKPLDKENLKEELGDIFFYMQKMMNMNGWTLGDVLQYNMNKLYKRYPQGYTDAAAQARADKIEEANIDPKN